MLRKFSLLFAITVILALSSCNQKQLSQLPSSDNDNVMVVENVPFVKQEDKFCGPAAMASVMQFYGQDIDQNEIAEEVYIPELNGALISDMENFAKAKGYKTVSTNGNIEMLKSHLDNNYPAILLVDKGKWKVSVPHYYVAYGYNDEKEIIILHTGFNEAQEISFEKLDKEWEKMNRLMLVVTN